MLSRPVFILASPAVYWILSTVYYVLQKVPFMQKYRVQPRSEEKRNTVSLGNVMGWVLLQHLSQILLSVVTLELFGDFPTGDSWTIRLVKLVASMICLDTWEFWLHRTMHVYPSLFRRFHSWHHRLYCPHAFGALYNHPVEGLLLDTLGTAVAMMVCFVDDVTAVALMCLATAKTVTDHSNLYCSWNPLCSWFPNHSKYHDFHHQLKGFKKNFQQPFFTFWDVWLGSYEAC